MNKQLASLQRAVSKRSNDQRGITGLETAIVLIAFVVVSSVFAFAALSTGMFSSEKARETIKAGLAETRATLELKGSVIGTSNAAGVTGTITTLKFSVAQGAGGASVDLTPGTTIIKYTDAVQSKLFATTAGFTVAGLGGADTDNLVERNEVYEITMASLDTLDVGNNDALDSALGIDTTFTIELIPIEGAILHIERTTPIFMEIVNFLD